MKANTRNRIGCSNAEALCGKFIRETEQFLSWALSGGWGGVGRAVPMAGTSVNPAPLWCWQTGMDERSVRRVTSMWGSGGMGMRLPAMPARASRLK